MSATSAPTAEFQDAGKPVAFPFYLVDVNGNPISSTDPLPVNVSLAATSVAIEDGTTASQKLAVDAGGRITSIIEAVAGTALAADQTNSELRVSLYITKSTAGDTALTVGQATMVNSIPVTVASNQTPLTAGTGTRTSVGSSASSVTILASNANRKGAIIYNDSTQILYLDLSGGTATSSSYSVQIPSNGYFELPGPAIYTGAITGIWAAANGNARITEFS